MGRIGQHRPSFAPRCVLPHPLQNRVPRGERAPVALCRELTEPAGETSPSLHFRHVMEESPSLPLLYSSLSHPASSASNRCYPLQHPERTRFRPFWGWTGCGWLFLSSLGLQNLGAGFCDVVGGPSPVLGVAKGRERCSRPRKNRFVIRPNSRYSFPALLWIHLHQSAGLPGRLGMSPLRK